MYVITSTNSIFLDSNPLELEECITLLHRLYCSHKTHKFSKHTAWSPDLLFIDLWSDGWDNSKTVAYKCIQACRDLYSSFPDVDFSLHFTDIIQDCLPSIKEILIKLNIPLNFNHPNMFSFKIRELFKLNPSRFTSLYKKVIRDYNKELDAEIKDIISKNEEDQSILLSLSHQGKTQENSDYRTSKRVKDIANFVGPKPFTNILDYGGGSGDLAHYMGKHYECNATNIDIKNWFSKDHQTAHDNVNYVFLSTHTLPFMDNTFDCITIIQVIHHLDNPLKTCKELFRVLQPNGFLFVREHNCENYEDKLTIDLEHILYETGRKSVDWNILNDFEACYMNKKMLRELLKSCGFKFIKDEPSRGVTNCYYSLWSK